MGYKLRRALRVALGAEIAGLQRAVALEIADDANDDTRMSLASLEDLALWTAAKDENVVRNALKRLAAAGWEFRVPLGKGRDGRVLYAVPGRRLTFRVPEFEGVSTATPKGESPLPLPPEGGPVSRPKGEPPLPQGVAPAPSEGATARSERAPATPFSSVPSVPSSLSAPAVPPSSMAAADEREKEHPHETPLPTRLMLEAGLSPNEAAHCLVWISERHKVRGLGFWHRVEQNGDAPALVAEWRAATTVAPPQAFCGLCDRGWLDRDNAVPCPTCKPHLRTTKAPYQPDRARGEEVLAGDVLEQIARRMERQTQ